ncbi:restriction endonuclease subunit S [Daeguia caeni]|uniref:Restriction endonuclease subunit S n=1 Tax=Daeguia caeni TaxID=439612 RepID=A0ABV9H033_9HYPH
MIPDGWRAIPFAELADYKAGRTPARANPDYWQGADDGVPWVAISDMTEFGTVTETKEKISRAAFREVFRGKTVPAGTLIMSFKLTIGRVATLGIDACHNEAIIAIHPRNGVDQRFLGYFLAQVDYDALQDRQVKGNTLNQEKIDRIEIWLPPNDEPKQIADVLDLVRHAIKLQDDGLATAQDLKRAAMRALFTKGLRGEAQKETEIGPVPESWEVVSIGSVATNTQYGLSVRGQPSGAYPILRMNCQEDGKVHFRNLQFVDLDEATFETFRLRPGDLLFNRTNSIDLVGRMAIVEDPRDAVFASYLVRVSLDEARCLPAYLNYFMNWPKTQSEIKKLASRAVGQANINATKLRTVLFPLPTVDEQREIVAVLEAIDRKIDLHRRKRAVLDDLFKALLHKLMTGEIRVADLDLSALDAKPVAEVAA